SGVMNLSCPTISAATHEALRIKRGSGQCTLCRARHNVHARRKFVEAADLLQKPGRPHEALAFYRELFRIERRIKDWSDEGRLRERQEKTVPLLAQFKAWLDHAVHTVLPKDTFGIAVNYALKHWDALTNFTKAGNLDASNNYAE